MTLPLSSCDYSIKSGKMSSVVFIWIGFLLAISFMESWLKFQAPGVTVSIGLGIGRLVFGALNKVEWVLFLMFIASSLRYLTFDKRNWLLPILLFLLLLVQTTYLLPTLDARATMYINGENLPKSNLHFYFIIAESIKLVLLFVLAIGNSKYNFSLKNNRYQYGNSIFL